MDYPNSNEKKQNNKNDDFLIGWNLREDNTHQNYTMDGSYYNKYIRSPFYYQSFDMNLISPIYNDEKPTPFKLNMFNHWYNYNRDFINPEVRYYNGIVLIQGLVNAGKDTTIGFLQELYRPTNRLIFNCNNHDNISRVDIDIDGRIQWIAGSRSYGWVSLSGILYVNMPSKLTNTKLIQLDPSIIIKKNIVANDKKYIMGNDESYNHYEVPMVSEIDGIIIIQGLVRKNNKNNNFNVLGKLPQNYQPTYKMIFNCNSHENTARIDIDPNGNIIWKDGLEEDIDNRLEIDNLLSLSNIFYSNTNNKLLSLYNGWEKFSDTYSPPSYRLYNNMVILQGLLKNNNASDIIAMLPVEIRPKGRLVFGTNSNKNNTRIDIFPDGNIKVILRNNDVSWISLCGIVFNL
jgi:hypothetical protein